MNARDLCRDPVWTGDELGRPIPDSPHAVSVALPRWQDVVGYEEGRPEVMERLSTGYPRFVIHPLVRAVATRLAGTAPCLPFPSARSASLCATFVRTTSGEPAQILSGLGVYGVATSEAGRPFLKAFWQHTGLIVSSRQAEAILAGGRVQDAAAAVRQSLRRQLARFYDCEPDDVFLTPSGMAAQFAALQVVGDRRPGQPTGQLGFPYVDTLKLQQTLGGGGILLHDLDRMDTELRLLLERQPLAACFCEIPGNPLLGSADVHEIAPLLRRHGVPLVVDDVVATACNVDLGPYADLIATSLTKYVVGTGDAMGGALILNPRSPFYRDLKPRAQAHHEELLWGEDAVTLDEHARTFPERVRRHNRNGLAIAERLRSHPLVERVWYPKWESCGPYEAVRRSDGGYGSLVTFLPKDAERRAPRVYDALAVCKGPSLGTVFTLACPFTLLAHYSELDWAESCGVSRYLIRLSVGLEDPDDLWGRLTNALEAA
jgi:cystathionine gamma-synthase